MMTMLKQFCSAAIVSAMLASPAFSMQMPYQCDSQDDVLRLDYYKAGSNVACAGPRACLFWDNLHVPQSGCCFSASGGPVPQVNKGPNSEVYEVTAAGQTIEFVVTGSRVRLAKMTRDGPNFFMTCTLPQ
jgi:hypothetical protein